jgi:hypothetical protein
MNNDKTIFRTVKQNRFVIVDKSFLNDPDLSLSAKGLLLYLLSKPDTFYHNVNDISNHCSNGRDSILTSIKELIKSNYLLKINKRAFDGTFDKSVWLVFESKDLYNDYLSKNPSISEEPYTGIPYTVKPSTDFPINNNNKKSNTDIIESITHTQPDFSNKCGLIDFFKSYFVEIPNDFDMIDLFELRESLNYFISNRSNITNPKSYLSKLIFNCRRLSEQEMDNLNKAKQSKLRKTEFQKNVESFEFSSIEEQKKAMEKFRHLDMSFVVYMDKPEMLPSLSLYFLKSLYLKYGDKDIN